MAWECTSSVPTARSRGTADFRTHWHSGLCNIVEPTKTHQLSKLSFFFYRRSMKLEALFKFAIWWHRCNLQFLMILDPATPSNLEQLVQLDNRKGWSQYCFGFKGGACWEIINFTEKYKYNGLRLTINSTPAALNIDTSKRARPVTRFLCSC